MSRINVRVDENLKNNATVLFKELGFDMTTAVNAFLAQSVREQRLPFQPSREPIESVIARQEVLNGEGETYGSLDEFMDSLNDL